MTMGNVALKVNNISKKYSTGTYDPMLKIRHAVTNQLRIAKRALLGRSISNIQPPPKILDSDFWALRDVSFEVRHGERVGIIGRNGAGKSTLLKILSGITRPTTGSIDVCGRLGALLEVGTGFHPELTGRENIFLNATILGLSKIEIVKKFDEIVDFAEIDQFIDTPVKFYSSGMFMRLAYSVSAHLDPDILILDEVLAVGDAAFQKKCMGHMEGVARNGRTVLLVSHSIAAVTSFCDRCILLDKGKVVMDGDAISVSEYYQESQGGEVELNFQTREMMKLAESNKNLKASITHVKTMPLSVLGEQLPVLRVGGNLSIEIGISAKQNITSASLTVSIFESSGQRIVDVGHALKNDYLNLSAGNRATVSFVLQNLLLRPGEYRISVWLGRPPIEDIDIILNAAKFTVEINPRKSNHGPELLGAYQCEFTHSILMNSS